MGTAAEQREAFEAFVATAYEPLQRFLRRRTDRATAEDVLGDALLVLWRRVGDIPADAPLAWAYGVARGCLANAVRSSTRQDRLVLRVAREPEEGAGLDHSALEEALEELPETDRELLRLWAWEQLPPREIALVLDISANAASIRLHRAIGKLKEKLGAAKEPGTRRTFTDRQGTEGTE
ncbi:MAG: RNA polymerase sigma factor [Sporichthyaceae bacterium]